MLKGQTCPESRTGNNRSGRQRSDRQQRRSLTSYISLPGRYLVLLPNKPGSGISRKVEDEEDRQKIKNIMKQIKIPEDMGFIVRTAGFNRTKQEIARDYQHLVRLWREIDKKAKSISKTSMIYQETDFGVRSLRDYLTSEIDEILVDDLETFRKMRAYLRAISPRYIRTAQALQRKNALFDSFHWKNKYALFIRNAWNSNPADIL